MLNLKNERARLSSILDVRIDETERNFKMDVARFEEEINRCFNNHKNTTRMLDHKVD